MALSLKQLQAQIEELSKQLNTMQDENSELRAKLESGSEVATEAEAQVEKLVRQNQEDPSSQEVLKSLQQIIGSLGQKGLFWRSSRGLTVTKAFDPSTYDIKQAAMELAAKNGWQLNPNWISVGPHFWRTRDVEKGNHAYARWRYDGKHDVWTPEIGGVACVNRRARRRGEFPEEFQNRMLQGNPKQTLPKQ